jgi:hypothetical protein
MVVAFCTVATITNWKPNLRNACSANCGSDLVGCRHFARRRRAPRNVDRRRGQGRKPGFGDVHGETRNTCERQRQVTTARKAPLPCRRIRRDRIQRVTDEAHLCSLSSDASRHFGYTGVTDNPSGTRRADDALAGAFHEEEVPFRWMSSCRTTRSLISAM